MQTLTYKGVEYPVLVSYYAIKHFQLETGKKIEDIDQDLSNLEILLFYALKSGANMENKEFNLRKEDMEFFLDSNLTEFNQILIGSFPDPSSSSGNKKK